jgi:uracil-DNA glycosylase family protein
MKVVRLQREHDFEEWRAYARALLLEGTPPDAVRWEVGPGGLFAGEDSTAPAITRRAVGVVPRRFVDLGQVALLHRDPARFALLYRLLFRLQKDPSLLASRFDPDVSRLYKMVSDLHLAAERARNLPPPAALPPTEDMPVDAQDKETPTVASLAEAREAVAGCRRCPLYEQATQAVFGEGPAGAEVMFVGEQPGDQEDRQGRPFVGPAGQMFDAALAAVGIDRRRVYVTNAVKHFKFTPRGKRRIHSKPNGGEISACRFWLDLERAFVRPKLVVALGATAAHSLMGKTVAVSALRGKKLELPDGATLLVTVHPSYLLRIPDREKAAAERARFEADLKAVRVFIDRRGDEARSGGPLAA